MQMEEAKQAKEGATDDDDDIYTRKQCGDDILFTIYTTEKRTRLRLVQRGQHARTPHNAMCVRIVLV
jgi:hypothetical protein